MTDPMDQQDWEDPFVAPVAMEEDPEELFAGDRGVLDADVRRVLVRLLQRRFQLLRALLHMQLQLGFGFAQRVHQPLLRLQQGPLRPHLAVTHDPNLPGHRRGRLR